MEPKIAVRGTRSVLNSYVKACVHCIKIGDETRVKICDAWIKIGNILH